MRICYAGKLALGGILRGWRQNTVAIICTGLGWLALGSFLVLFLNLSGAKEQIRGNALVEVYLNDDINSLQLHFLLVSLEGLPQVEQVEFRSRREALSQMENLLGPQALAGLNAEVLPSSFVLHLKKGHRSYQEASALAARVKAWQGVEDVEYGGKWLKQTELGSRRFFLGLTVFGIMLVLAAAAMLAGFTRTASRSQKQILQIMSLLGAGWNDQAIFLMIQGSLLGGGGALIGLACLRALYWLLAGALSAHEFLPGSAILGLIAAGAILGALGTIAWSVRNPSLET
jgi:cell division transport system permease protein